MNTSTFDRRHTIVSRINKAPLALALKQPRSLLSVVALLSGCASETLFQSGFDANALNQPPAQNQVVGTVSIDGAAGNVLVVPPPVTPSEKWVQIRRPTAQSSVTALQGNFSQPRGDGTYVFSTFLYIPSGSGVATLQFERFSQPVTVYDGFLHLDFLPDNTVRIDDDVVFGTFPRDQIFVVQVTLDINASSASAHIVLSGADASGTADYNVKPAFLPMAQQFGAVRAWMGFPHTGLFDVTLIVVKKRE